MKDKNLMTLIQFEKECEEQQFKSYIFASENQNQDDYNVRFALTFDSLKVIYYLAYNSVYLGQKGNFVMFDRVKYVERSLDLDFCKYYVLYCKDSRTRKLRKFSIIAMK